MIVYIGGLVVAMTPLVLGLVALVLGRKEDYPEILRSVFWRRGRRLCLCARNVTWQLDVAADVLLACPPYHG